MHTLIRAGSPAIGAKTFERLRANISIGVDGEKKKKDKVSLHLSHELYNCKLNLGPSNPTTMHRLLHHQTSLTLSFHFNLTLNRSARNEIGANGNTMSLTAFSSF